VERPAIKNERKRRGNYVFYFTNLSVNSSNDHSRVNRRPRSNEREKMYSTFSGNFPSFEETFYASNIYALQFVPHNSSGKKRKTINGKRASRINPIQAKQITVEFKKFQKHDVILTFDCSLSFQTR